MSKVANVEKTKQSILNLNLRIFFILLMGIVLFLGPFQRGLYFRSELYPALIITGLAFIFCIYDQVLQRDDRLFNHPLDWSVLALVVVYALSLINAVNISSAIDAFLKAAAFFMMYWLACRAAAREKAFNALLVTIYLAGVGVAVLGLLAAAGTIDWPGAYEKGQIMSTLQYPNTLAIYLAALNIIGLALGVKTERLLPRILYAVGNFLMVVVIVGTQSRGGWILYPLGLAFLIYIIPYTYRWRAIYQLMIYMGCGLVTTSGFFNNLHNPAGNPLAFIITGAIAVTILQTFYYLLAAWLNRDAVTENIRKLAAAGGALYIGIVSVIYLWYAAAAFPVAVAGILPAQAIAQAQKISGQEASFQARMEFNQDALEIVKDYPLTGAGGGGWDALYHSYAERLYWTSETHNYFTQVWVEAGTLGILALLAAVVTFIMLLRNYSKKQRGEKEASRLLAWSAGTTVIIIFIHSAFDFDISITAIGFLLYALMGVVKGHSDAIKSRKKKTSRDERPETKPRTHLRLPGIAAAGTILGLVVIYPAYTFYQAGIAGAAGAEALQAQELDRAVPHYQEAIRRDPFKASYKLDLAQIRYAQSLANDDAVAYFEALKYAGEAAQTAPYDAAVQQTLVNLYSSMKEDELMVNSAEALVRANPLLASNYEILAAALQSAANHNLAAGDPKQADAYLNRILSIEKMLPAYIEELSPALRLSLGQASLLLGREQNARNYLEPAHDDKELGYQVQLWLAAAYAMEGRQEQAQGLLENLTGEKTEAYTDYQKIMQLISKYS